MPATLETFGHVATDVVTIGASGSISQSADSKAHRSKTGGLFCYLLVAMTAASSTKTKADEPLFATSTNTHIDRNNLRHMLNRVAEAAGITGVHPHRFRHTFAVEFLRNGGNVFELQQILGHEQLTTVQRYVRLAEVDLENAGRRSSPADNWKV